LKGNPTRDITCLAHIMISSQPIQNSIEILYHNTGVVIPVYFPQEIDTSCGEQLLYNTVASYAHHVADPAAICLSVDGADFGAGIAAQLAGEFGVRNEVSPVNRGKLHSAEMGIRSLLGNQMLRYLTVVDQDGDHFANELLNMIHAAESIRSNLGSERVLVLGQRRSRHHPMGFYRGELEELADRILLDALGYHAAVSGTPLRLEYANSIAEFPDFHSGYKLFDRTTATLVFTSKPQRAGVSDRCYYHHACEAVMTVEALLHQAYLATVQRSTTNEQAVSTFNLYGNSRLTADMIIWPCKRLGVPLPFVRQWLANHIPRLLLYTLAPEGKNLLEEIQQLVIGAFTGNPGKPETVQFKPPFL